jgi:hypothetical protein
MSTPNEDANVSETPIFHPFPEPSTMPSGWDLSGLTSDPQPVSSSQGAPVAPVEDSTDSSTPNR